MTTKDQAQEDPKNSKLAREVAIQAELLALNFALEGKGAGETAQSLTALARDLRQATAPKP